jgi:hypothetical protein
MTQFGKRTKAYHEAGHAVIARTLGVGVTYVALRLETTQTVSAAYLAETDDIDDIPARIAALEKDTKVFYAGAQAQHRYRPLSRGQLSRAQSDVGVGSDDWANAKSAVAKAVLLQHGKEPVAGTE